MIQGIPWGEFLRQDIHSSEESQFEEKSEEIQVAKDKRVRFFHPLAQPLEMAGHFGPMETRTVMVTEVVSFIHKVHLVHDSNSVREIIIRPLWVTERVLDPRGDGVDEIHAENRNQYVKHPNSPVVDKDQRAVAVETRHSA